MSSHSHMLGLTVTPTPETQNVPVFRIIRISDPDSEAAFRGR